MKGSAQPRPTPTSAGRSRASRAKSNWNRTSLWHFFKTSSFWRGPKLLRPVLVIDQFEELFTLYPAAEYRQFIDELSDLVRGTRPRESADREAPGLSDAPPEVTVMLALREDFCAQLEELRQRIPAIYKAPFRLEPLARKQARHAIVEPAGLEDDDLAVPPFNWADDAVTKILDFLSEQQMGEGRKQVGDEIEPFQLQLICQHVEDLVGERGLATIAADDLGGNEGLTRVLSGFYESCLTKICDRFKDEPDLRQKLEELCEYGFITARGRRLLREESTIMQEDGVSAEILRELVELRLLRKEPRVGDNYYELTHDTLIEPIKLSRLDREERAARALEEQRVREAREHAERERSLRVGSGSLLPPPCSCWSPWAQPGSTRGQQHNRPRRLRGKPRPPPRKRRMGNRPPSRSPKRRCRSPMRPRGKPRRRRPWPRRPCCRPRAPRLHAPRSRSMSSWLSCK